MKTFIFGSTQATWIRIELFIIILKVSLRTRVQKTQLHLLRAKWEDYAGLLCYNNIVFELQPISCIVWCCPVNICEKLSSCPLSLRGSRIRADVFSKAPLAGRVQYTRGQKNDIKYSQNDQLTNIILERKIRSRIVCEIQQ